MQSYRIKDPTLAIVNPDRRNATVPLPAGSIITAEETESGDMVRIVWNGRRLSMFAKDLQQRAEPLPRHAA